MFLIKTMHNKKRRRNFLTSPLVFIRFFALSRKSICHILFGLIISRVAVGQRISSCASAQHIELMVALVPASIYRKSACADLYRRALALCATRSAQASHTILPRSSIYAGSNCYFTTFIILISASNFAIPSIISSKLGLSPNSMFCICS